MAEAGSDSTAWIALFSGRWYDSMVRSGTSICPAWIKRAELSARSSDAQTCGMNSERRDPSGRQDEETCNSSKDYRRKKRHSVSLMLIRGGV